MEKFNLRSHNKKIMEFTKNVANGTYPSRKVARMGSFVGIATGILLTVIGCITFFAGGLLWIGSFLAGIVTVISNIINLKRINKRKKT